MAASKTSLLSSAAVCLGMKNIGGERYFSASDGTFRIAFGQPRTFYGGLRFEF